MKKDYVSSHFGHIAFVVLAFLIGGIVGYAYGQANQEEVQADNGSGWAQVFSHKTKTKATASPQVSPSLVSPSASATSSPAVK